MIDLQKLEVANNVLSLMGQDIWLSTDKGYLQVNWKHQRIVEGLVASSLQSEVEKPLKRL
jgi:hypothetical protein